MTMQRYTLLVNRPPSEHQGLIFEEREESSEESPSDNDDDEIVESTGNHLGDTDHKMENDDAKFLRIRGGGRSNILNAVKDAVGSATTAAMSSSSLFMSAAASAATSPASLPSQTCSRPRAIRARQTSNPFPEANPFTILVPTRASVENTKNAINWCHKRKRPATICISEKSPIFKAVRLIRKQISDISVGDLDYYDDEWLKFALANVLKPRIIVLKVEHKIHRTADNVFRDKRTFNDRNYRNGRRRSCSYFKSSYYKTIWLENKSGGADELTKIISNPVLYPMYLTVQRWIKPSTVAQPAKSTDGEPSNPPPRKRIKRDPSTRGKANELKVNQNEVKPTQQPPKVICLLDSSDEEEEGMLKAKEKLDGDCSPKADALHRDTNELSSFMPKKLTSIYEPPPDPFPNSFKAEENGDFVLTPYGAGKIVSSRVERYASTSGEASIPKPTIIYSIDLHFGVCHVPSSQVRSISGTSYVKNALLTYSKVPLTAMDLLRLRPMTYLNDSIVNFYLKYLKVKIDKSSPTTVDPISRGWDSLDGDGVYVFPSFCYNRIVNIMGSDNRNNKANRLKIWTELKTWTKGVDIFKKKMLVFPINDMLHWSVLIVFHPGRLIRRHAIVEVDSAKEIAKSKIRGSQHEAVLLGSDDNKTKANSTVINRNELVSCNDLTNSGGSEGELAEDGLASVRNCLACIVIQFARPSKTVDLPQKMTSIPTNENIGVKTTTEQSKRNTHWMCDHCDRAIFDSFAEAGEHEKKCPKNQDWCMLHFDSGRHFKLHDSKKICGYIRKYLGAYYDSEYASTHPSVGPLTQLNMPGYTSLVPQQDNTKDCGVYMLEIVEQLLSNPPVVDGEFVRNKCKVFAKDLFPKDVIEKKREDILRLVHSLRLAEKLD
ncbi:hypothetical protein ACHAWX_003834 [Stephanocyclus meneghinianus]